MDLEKIWDLRVKDKIIKSASWEKKLSNWFLRSFTVAFDMLFKLSQVNVNE